jgi:hypothetical protein
VGSGTTAVAGIIATLGARGVGAYYQTSDPRTPNSYESVPFRDIVGRFASEKTVALKPGSARAALTGLRDFRRRIVLEEFGTFDPSDAVPIFFKYPLSALLLRPICEVFDTRLIYVIRPLADIEITRARRRWTRQYGSAGGEIIYRAMNEFARLESNPIYTLDYADLLMSPGQYARELARFAGVEPDSDAIGKAADFVRHSKN